MNDLPEISQKSEESIDWFYDPSQPLGVYSDFHLKMREMEKMWKENLMLQDNLSVTYKEITNINTEIDKIVEITHQ